MSRLWMMEVVPTIEASESPVEPGLMLVMAGTVFCQLALAVRRYKRMNVRPKVWACVLSDDWFLIAVPENG